MTGQIFTFDVTFTDNFVQHFSYTVPSMPSGITALGGTVTPSATALNVSWDKCTDPDFSDYYVSVEAWDANGTRIGDSRILEKNINDVNTTSTSIALHTSTYDLVAGSRIQINVGAYSNIGYQRAYYSQYIVP